MMQIRSVQRVPTRHSQAFAANNARFGMTQNRSKPHDPAFTNMLTDIESNLNPILKNIESSHVQFTSCTTNPVITQCKIKSYPQINFKLNGANASMTIISPPDSKRFEYILDLPEITFEFRQNHHDPQDSYIHFTTRQRLASPSQNAFWTKEQGYDPSTYPSNDYNKSDYPRPDMVEKATELGKLLLTKLGESGQAQGLGPLALPEPPKQLDHPA